MPPTDKQVRVSGINIEHIVDGKIVECWHNFDMLGLASVLPLLAAAIRALKTRMRLHPRLALWLPDWTIAKAIGIHQLRLGQSIGVHDPDFATIRQTVQEKQLGAIGRPIRTVERGISHARGQPGYVRSVRIHEVYLSMIRSIRGEGNLLVVRRPAWSTIFSWALRHLLESRAVRIHHIDDPVIGSNIGHKSNFRAIRRPIGILLPQGRV